MKVIEPTVFCILILGALSMTQTDVLARGGHKGHEPYHAVLGYHDEGRSPSEAAPAHEDRSEAPSSHSAPERAESQIVTPDSGMTGVSRMNASSQSHMRTLDNQFTQGYAHENDVAYAHPESATKSDSCKGVNPMGC